MYKITDDNKKEFKKAPKRYKLVEDFDNGVTDEAVGTPVVQELSDDDWS
jgi:hypothetical protein